MDQAPSQRAEKHPIGTGEHWPAGPGLLASVWLHRVIMLVSVGLGVLAGFWGADLQPVQYEAHGSLLIDHDATYRALEESGRRVNPERNLRNRVEQVQSFRVMQVAAELLGPGWSVTDLYEEVEVSRAGTLDVITITATADTAEQAADVVNAVGEAYLGVSAADASNRAAAQILEIEAAIERVRDRQQSLSDQVADEPEDPVLLAQRDAAVRELIDLTSRVERLSVTEQLPPSGVSAFEPALPPRRPSQPGPRRTAALGALAGLALGGTFAWWKAGQGKQVTDPRTVARILGAPVLMSIPHTRRRKRAKIAADRYRSIAVILGQATRDMATPLIGFASANHGEGATTVAHRTALASTEDRDVMLVDGDPANRTLTRRYRLTDHPGLTDLAWGLVPLARVRHLLGASGGRPLSLVPLGQSVGAVGGLTGRMTLGGALHGGEGTQMVLVDCGAVLGLSETVVLLGQTDATVIVVREGTRVEDLKRMRERLAFSDSPVIGVVYNGARSRRSGG